MSEFTRTIHIRSDNLGKDTTFMLAFDSGKIPGLYRIVFPIAWKVVNLPKAGHCKFTVIIKQPFGVSADRISGSGIAFPPLAYTPLKEGEQTSLLKRDNEYYFSTPTPSVSRIPIIKNETTSVENFGIGNFDHTPASPPSTSLLYEHIGAGSAVEIYLNHILRGYVTSDYKEGDIMRGQVTSPVLFQQDLLELDQVTYWKIDYDPRSGVYTVQRDSEY